FLGIEGGAKPASRPPGPRGPFGAGIPIFLQPGRDQWKRKIKDAALAVRNYDVVVTGRDSVAGHDCEVVEVKARHEGRPSYRVAIDAQNRFPLRFEVLSQGRTVFETWFSEIEYRPAFPAKIFDERFRPNWLRVSQEEVAADRMADVTGFAV